MEITGPWNEELIGFLPRSIQYLCHMGAGYDSIDVGACTEWKILVSNVPGVVEESTADAAMFLILAALRGFNNGIMAIRNKTWKGKTPPPPLGHNPQGKILGILGMGGIGSNVKVKAEAFGMNVIYHNRKPLDDKTAGGADYVGFDDLLAKSDVLSLNLPLNANTRHIISTAAFQKMKRGIVIVNTARGGVLDEKALVQAIEDGIVRSVGLDVYEQEPNIHPGLVDNPHVCLLPHMGTSTVEVSSGPAITYNLGTDWVIRQRQEWKSGRSATCALRLSQASSEVLCRSSKMLLRCMPQKRPRCFESIRTTPRSRLI